MDKHAVRSLDRRIVVRTPENLEINYELAGVGTRAAAYFIDLALMAFVMVMLQNLLIGLFAGFARSDAGLYVIGAVGLVSFLFFNSYFIVFELHWAGQSPGKRVIGIRVVKTGGYALRFQDSLVRNLMRALDFVPVFYAAGFTCILLTPRCQRLGDLVAGTLVVYHDPTDAAREISAVPARNRIEAPAVRPGMIPADLIEVCDEYLRTMSELSPKYRQSIAELLVELVESTSGVRPNIRQSSETFLREVILQSAQSLPET